MNLRTVEKRLLNLAISKFTCEPTRENDRLNVRNVEIALQDLATSINTLKFAQGCLKMLKERAKVRERRNISNSLFISALILSQHFFHGVFHSGTDQTMKYRLLIG